MDRRALGGNLGHRRYHRRLAAVGLAIGNRRDRRGVAATGRDDDDAADGEVGWAGDAVGLGDLDGGNAVADGERIERLAGTDGDDLAAGAAIAGGGRRRRIGGGSDRIGARARGRVSTGRSAGTAWRRRKVGARYAARDRGGHRLLGAADDLALVGRRAGEQGFVEAARVGAAGGAQPGQECHGPRLAQKSSTGGR